MARRHDVAAIADQDYAGRRLVVVAAFDVVNFSALVEADERNVLAAWRGLRREIDPLIAETAERWRPERMAVLDRLILRMAVGEMLRDRGTPPAVIINEALELARTFSTEESVKFINGMLDAIRKKVDKDK